MSKDFEKEYRELAQNEIPDLWDRIEAGLTEKSTPEITIVNYRADTKKNAKVASFLKKYAGLAAAILCVALIIPASNFILRSGGKSSSADSSVPQEANGAADDTAYDTAVSEEACEAATEETADDVAAAAEDVAEEAAEVEWEAAAADKAEAEGTQGTVEEASVKTREEGSAEEMKQGAAAGAADQGEKLCDMSSEDMECPLLTNVVVQVVEKKKDVYGEDGSGLSGTVYMVIVREDASGILSEAEQIEVYLPADSSDMVVVKSEMEMDLIRESSGDYDYVVNKVYP